MNNTIRNLNDALMNRIEALAQPDLEGDALAAEVRRSDATVKLGAQVIASGRLMLDADRHMTDFSGQEAGAVLKQMDAPAQEPPPKQITDGSS